MRRFNVLDLTFGDQPEMSGSVDYVVRKLNDHDLVMIGERHWTHEEPVFIQKVLMRCYEEIPINYLFLEFGRFVDQAKAEAFLSSPNFDSTPVVDILRNSYEFGWGYQEYFDIFKLIYEENHSRPPPRRVKIILVDGPPDGVELWT